ncbi:hypothetical protein AAFF_G00143060 [Aldrovandia affinis]|uniref:Uncharacterized protein n=1 Tax=Aldrovandia affinis TaxID=143900 RepID=A0AAD7T0A6_9TELE|nr:hypothetical protein AAFF_G00143060 [Aldrovandia affinis]
MPEQQLADRKAAALSPQHHRQWRRRHRAPPVDPLGNGGRSVATRLLIPRLLFGAASVWKLHRVSIANIKIGARITKGFP